MLRSIGCRAQPQHCFLLLMMVHPHFPTQSPPPGKQYPAVPSRTIFTRLPPPDAPAEYMARMLSACPAALVLQARKLAGSIGAVNERSHL